MVSLLGCKDIDKMSMQFLGMSATPSSCDLMRQHRVVPFLVKILHSGGQMQSKEIKRRYLEIYSSLLIPERSFQISVTSHLEHAARPIKCAVFLKKWIPPNIFLIYLKVSTFQKQIFLISFEPKNKRNYFLNSVLASKMSQINKKEGILLYYYCN